MAAGAVAQNITVNVSVKVVHGPATVPGAGGVRPSPWPTANSVTTTISAAQAILNQCQVTLNVTEIVDIPDPFFPVSWFNVNLGGTATGLVNKIRMEQAAESRPSDYLWRTNAINVYLVNSITGPAASGFCSFPTGTPGTTVDNDDLIFVAAPPVGITTGHVLAHEIGHYLGLYHTFETFLGVESVNASFVCQPGANAATAGDQIVDTRADPNNLTTLTATYGNCGTVFTNLRNNVMSYYAPAPGATAILTAAQSARARLELLAGGRRTHVITGAAVPTITGVTVSSTAGGLDTLQLTGTNFPTTGAVDVAVGEVLCTAAACGAERVAFNVPCTATTATAVFPQNPGAVPTNPIPPGRHTVGLYKNGDLVAWFAAGVSVGPTIENTVFSPVTGLGLLRIRAAVNALVMVVLNVETPFPTALPAGYVYLELSSPPPVTFFVTTDSAGVFDQYYSLYTFLSGSLGASPTLIQAVDTTTNLLSNFKRLIAP